MGIDSLPWFINMKAADKKHDLNVCVTFLVFSFYYTIIDLTKTRSCLNVTRD